MKTHRVSTALLFGTILLLWILTLCPGDPRAFAQEIIVIAHKEVQPALDKDELKQIFLGKKTRWDDKGQITFVLPSDKQLCAEFFKEYLGKSSSQYLNFWKKQVFTGKGRMPRFFQTEDELIRFVAQNQGAISFITGTSPLINANVNTISIAQD